MRENDVRVESRRYSLASVDYRFVAGPVVGGGRRGGRGRRMLLDLRLKMRRWKLLRVDDRIVSGFIGYASRCVRHGHRFGRGVAIVDAEPRLGSVDLRHWNVARCSIGPHNLGPQPRHRF